MFALVRVDRAKRHVVIILLLRRLLLVQQLGGFSCLPALPSYRADAYNIVQAYQMEFNIETRNATLITENVIHSEIATHLLLKINIERARMKID